MLGFQKNDSIHPNRFWLSQPTWLMKWMLQALPHQRGCLYHAGWIDSYSFAGKILPKTNLCCRFFINRKILNQTIYIYCTLMHIDAYCHSNLCFGIRGSVSTCFHRTSFAPGTILVQIWGLNVLSYHRSVLTHLGCEAKHKNNGRQGCNNVAIRSTNANTLQTLQSRRRYLHDRCFIRSKVQWTKMLVWPVF
jgi:hypothetical protein